MALGEFYVNVVTRIKRDFCFELEQLEGIIEIEFILNEFEFDIWRSHKIGFDGAAGLHAYVTYMI